MHLRRRSTSPNRSARAILWTAGACILLLGSLLSPLGLQALSTQHLNWTLLSDVGQTYGGTSAVLSALALLAVSYTTAIQVQESRNRRHESNRLMHLELIKLSLENPEYLASWGAPDKGLERRQIVYTNLVMNYWFHQHRVGVLKEVELVKIMKSAFVRPEVNTYWKQSRESWKEIPNNVREKHFIDVVDAVYHSSEPVQQSSSEESERASNQTRRLLAVSIGSLVMGIAISRLRPRKISF
jgi:hypothetical protein